METRRRLRLALVSYEFLGLASGGIGTYMFNVAKAMGARGHDVHVFSGQAGPSTPLPGVTMHRISGERTDFARNVLDAFSQRHTEMPFDLVEGREYQADVFHIFNNFSHIARVVKLATPTFLVTELNHAYLPMSAKIRFLLGSARRAQIPRPYWRYRDDPSDPERLVTLAADEVTSPSRALIDVVARRWPLDPARCCVIPHLFPPPTTLTDLAADASSDTILFLGKVEARKGVIDIVDAVPRVAEVLPNVRFRFVGRILPAPGTGLDMDRFLTRRLGQHAHRVTFSGDMCRQDALNSFAEAALCVFPSYWEAFGFVALEGMSAGRPVIGSASGGMAEIIEDGRTGVLVPPGDPKAIASAIIALMRDPARRTAMGQASRAHVLQTYSADAIGPLQEASYHRAISHARQRSALVVA